MDIRFILVVVVSAVLGTAQAQQLRPDLGVIPERFQLENGMSVVLCTVGQTGPISAQFYYEFSQFNDPGDLPQANRLLAKMRERAAFEGYDVDEAMGLMNEVGIASSDGLPSCVRVQYGAYAGDLDLIFSIEAGRMQGVDADEQVRSNAREWMNEVLDMLESPFNPPVMTPAISAAAHYWANGADHVSLRGTYDADSSAQIDDLLETSFSPERATLVIFGGFDSVTIRDMVTEYFSGIEPRGGELAEITPTGDQTEITWDLNETVVVLAYDAPDDRVAAAALTVWGQLLAGVLTNDKEVKPLLTGITSNQLSYPVGAMPVVIYGRVRDGQDPKAAVEALIKRTEAIVAAAPSKLDFTQLGNTTRMFIGRYNVNAGSIERRAGSVRRQLDLKKRIALLTATQQMGGDIAMIEMLLGPDVRETASLLLDIDNEQLVDILTATINEDNRSVVLIRPAGEPDED